MSPSYCIKYVEDLENIILLLYNIKICGGCDNFNIISDIKSKLGPQTIEFYEPWYHSKCTTVLLKNNKK